MFPLIQFGERRSNILILKKVCLMEITSYRLRILINVMIGLVKKLPWDFNNH